jgi:hypothetical protein
MDALNVGVSLQAVLLFTDFTGENHRRDSVQYFTLR